MDALKLSGELVKARLLLQQAQDDIAAINMMPDIVPEQHIERRLQFVNDNLRAALRIIEIANMEWKK